MKYLVLGCGADSMGEAIAARLLKEEEAQVFITDKNLANVDRTYGKIKKTLNANLKWFLPDGAGLDIIKQKWYLPLFFKDFDIIISAIPAALNPIIAEAVIIANERYGEKKTNYLDLGGVLGITKKIIFGKKPDLARRAADLGISLVPDCGLQPGLGNIIAMELLEKFDPKQRLESLIIYVGGLPYNFTDPPYYKKLFNLGGLAEIYYNSPLVLHKGRPIKIRKFSHYETISTREFDLYFSSPDTVKFEAAVTGGLGSLPYYLKNHVETLREKTLRFEGHYKRVKAIPRGKFEEIFTHWLESFQVTKKDFTVMKVVAISKSAIADERIKIEKLLYSESDENWTSMQKTTGFTTAVLAKLIADGYASPGAYPPEIALDPKVVLKTLEKDFNIYERTTPLK